MEAKRSRLISRSYQLLFDHYRLFVHNKLPRFFLIYKVFSCFSYLYVLILLYSQASRQNIDVNSLQNFSIVMKKGRLFVAAYINTKSGAYSVTTRRPCIRG